MFKLNVPLGRKRKQIYRYKQLLEQRTTSSLDLRCLLVTGVPCSAATHVNVNKGYVYTIWRVIDTSYNCTNKQMLTY